MLGVVLRAVTPRVDVVGVATEFVPRDMVVRVPVAPERVAVAARDGVVAVVAPTTPVAVAVRAVVPRDVVARDVVPRDTVDVVPRGLARDARDVFPARVAWGA